MTPGKNDHYTKKVNGGKNHVQKRYLLWALRDILDMLNGSNISVSNSFKDMFEKELSFTLFYKFIKARNQYIFNCKIYQNTCLCQTCENAFLFTRGLNQACKKSITCDPHAIVEEYYCNSNEKDCMLSICEECKSHIYNRMTSAKEMMKPTKMMEIVQAALIVTETMKQYANITSGKGGLTKIRIETKISESLTLWQTAIKIMKAHIHAKRREFTEITGITDNLIL